MNTIRLKYVIPHVFASREQQDSEIWQQDVVFEKDRLYLIEADSGKGKSTLCSYLIGYRHDYTGSIFFDDVDSSQLKIGQWVDLRTKHISHLFQELRLFPELTAYENIEIKNKLTNHQSKEQILEWFEMLGITDRLNAKMGRMSFGQQQRVALIRALCQPFDFLFVDEPISHLDDTNAAIMGQIMTTEAKKQGAGIIATSIGKHIELPYDQVFNL